MSGPTAEPGVRRAACGNVAAEGWRPCYGPGSVCTRDDLLETCAVAEAISNTMTADEFLTWNLEQEERYELVDGVPTPLRAQTGASNTHDAIVVNVISVLRNKLRGSGCRPTTADTAVRTSIRRVRRPDVTVECAPSDAGSYEARNPLVVFEVLSPSTRQIDALVKLEEYRRHPTIRHIVVIEPNIMSALVYTREDTGTWRDQPLRGPETEIRLSAVAVTLTLADVYEGVPLPAGPAAG